MKIGQFFIIGFHGMVIPENFKDLVQRYGLGGIIIYKRNVESRAQVEKLVQDCRSLSDDPHFIVTIDQEGGRAQHLPPPHFSPYPPAGELKSDNISTHVGAMAKELAALGFNLDLAPVLDVNTNPKNPIIGNRSFSPDPQVVTTLGRLFVEELKRQGLMACGKHFPGHGATTEDSHLDLPTLPHTLQDLKECELIPFRELIRGKIPFIMTAHILFPKIDPNEPATFSKIFMQDILRKDLGFEGVLISDDLQMKGALSQGSLHEVAGRAFMAGCDLLIVSHCEDYASLFSAFEKQFSKNSGLKARAEESATRIKETMSKHLSMSSLSRKFVL